MTSHIDSPVLRAAEDDARDRERFSLADLRAIAARVIAEVKANPPAGPLLGEREAGPDVCRRGHQNWGGSATKRRCLTCKRAARLRREGRS